MQGKREEIKTATVKLILAFHTFWVFYFLSQLFSQYTKHQGSVAWNWE